MSDPVVLLEDISVRFRIPHDGVTSFKEFAIKRPQRRFAYDDLWVLRHVTISVAVGEALGVVGRNGAGKSTLLRLVARVMHPTSGRVRVVGKVAPLLELGAGFHPELTGRENVYLNGALLGRSRGEISRKFDDIVSFAGLTEFVDVPLRTYSSGMSAGLGFAIATAWQPDILLVDETLSVGDEAFQRKCGDRIARFRASGTSIVLVSHDLSLIRETCERAIWIDRGEVRLAGKAHEVTDAYHAA